MFSAFLLLLVLSSPPVVFGLRILGCSGSVVLLYDPPLTPEMGAVTVTQFINFTTCSDLLNKKITAGWTQRVLHINSSCHVLNVSIPQVPPATFTFTWVAPSTPYSTIYFPTGSAVTIAGSSQTIRTGGNVTSGTFMGGSAALSLTIPVLNITACVQGDLATLIGTATLGIIDLFG